MVKLHRNNTIDLSDEFAATGHPGPYNVKTTTTGGKTGTEIIQIEVSPVSHPDKIVYVETTMRDLMNARTDIDYLIVHRNEDKIRGINKRKGAQWKQPKFYTPIKKQQR